MRTAACNQLPGFCAYISPDIVLADVLPHIQDISCDSSQYVRAALGSNISGLAPIFGKQAYKYFLF